LHFAPLIFILVHLREAGVAFRGTHPVNECELTYEEFQQACRACRWIRIPSSPEPYMREFLAVRLETVARPLAGKIRTLDDEQFGALCRAIRDKQELTA
jgi:hypothetical protein